ncbi:phage head closure protein [Marinibacterium profundimaris]|uniref:Tail protein n=1 Tax=Marinibacterium profundimaris TaxID=1679460 RepID=A0A225NZK7_9RHOB|nr:phage head closure protein [Marinibacterium profundimaris]OWU77516.1 tail protein [Marinibacterium profundimaris]
MSRPRLNRKLVLESRDRVPDGAGGKTRNWEALGTLWAEVTARSGRERSSAGLPVSRSSYEIKVRAAPVGSPSRPRPDQRFREGERIYAIRAVTETDSGSRYLVCYADEEVTA